MHPYIGLTDSRASFVDADPLDTSRPYGPEFVPVATDFCDVCKFTLNGLAANVLAMHEMTYSAEQGGAA